MFQLFCIVTLSCLSPHRDSTAFHFWMYWSVLSSDTGDVEVIEDGKDWEVITSTCLFFFDTCIIVGHI